MNESARRRRRLWSVPALLATLLLTTGWTQAAPYTVAPAAPSVGRAVNDLGQWNPPLETLAGGSQARDKHPQRTFAAPVRSAPTPIAAHVPTSVAHSYAGRNHFWIPSLGISQDVYSYRCGRTSDPANLIYRWGCAGANNVYLLGHAYGVMKPLHDAYVAGRLHVGMIAIYADANGNIRTYQVTSWQVVRPTVVAWATASQRVASMTLQTCVGSRSQYRLDVRLVAVD